MSKKLDEYNKALKKLNFNKFDFSQHKIDKNKIVEAYKQYATQIKNAEANAESLNLDDLIRYEKWLMED